MSVIAWLEFELAYDDVIFMLNPSARTGYDIRSILKRSLTGVNSEFSFWKPLEVVGDATRTLRHRLSRHTSISPVRRYTDLVGRVLALVAVGRSRLTKIPGSRHPCPYLPTPPLGQDITQGQFLSGVQQVWIQSFPSPRLVASPRLKNTVCPTIYP